MSVSSPLLGGYDEPEVLRCSNPQICPTGAQVRHRLNTLTQVINRESASVVQCALRHPESDGLPLANGELFLAMRHPEFGRSPPIDHRQQVALDDAPRDYHRAMVGPLHQAFVGPHVEAALLIAFAARLMAPKASEFENREHVLLKTDRVRGGR